VEAEPRAPLLATNLRKLGPRWRVLGQCLFFRARLCHGADEGDAR